MSAKQSKEQTSKEQLNIGQGEKLALLGQVVLEDRIIPSGMVIIAGDRIVAAGPVDREVIAGCGQTVDYGTNLLVPGLIDLHVHGALGLDTIEDAAGALRNLASGLPKDGVTSFLPAFATAPDDVLEASLSAGADYIDALAISENLSARNTANSRSTADGGDIRPGARPLGLHLEGPYVSAARRGGHPAHLIRDPNPVEFDRFWRAARGHLRRLTLAPELPGGEAMVALAAVRGVLASPGHTDAGYEAAGRAFAAGARLVTHVFNGTRPVEGSDPGIVGAALDDDAVYLEIVPDPRRVHPAAVSLLARAKGPDRLIVATDGGPFLGVDSAHHYARERGVRIAEGFAYDAGGKPVATTAGLDAALRRLKEWAGLTVPQALRAVTLNPARLLGLDAQIGRLAPGCRADVTVLNGELRAVACWIGGRPAAGRVAGSRARR